jgi:hypothetical protein
MLIGVVEEVGVREKKAFNNLQELWKILNPKDGVPKKSKKNKKTNHNGF